MHLMYVDESGDSGFPSGGAAFPGSGTPTRFFVRVAAIVHDWKWQTVNRQIDTFRATRPVPIPRNVEIHATEIRRGRTKVYDRRSRRRVDRRNWFGLNYPAPEWTELGTAFRVTFFPHPAVAGQPVADVPVNVPVNVRVNSRQKWFLEKLSEGVRVTADDLAQHWDVSEKTARRDIAELRKAGVVEFVGAPRTGRFVLKQTKGPK